MLRGQHAEEGLENDFRFPQAGVEIVVKAIEPLPASTGLDGQPLGKVSRSLAELPRELRDGVRKDAQLVEEAGAIAEKHVMQNPVPGRGATARIAPVETRVQRLYGRQRTQSPPVHGQRLAERGQRFPQGLEQFRGDRHLLPRADQLATAAK